MKIPIIIVLIIWLLGIGGLFAVIIHFDGFQLASVIIQIFSVLIAATAATFVVWSFIITNKAFIESREPTLIIGASGRYDGGSYYTIIDYKNITKNAFHDLRIIPTLHVGDDSVVINKLADKPMFMSGEDPRRWTFNMDDELTMHEINIHALKDNKVPLSLNIAYSYTYLGEKKNIDVQAYKWNWDINSWDIS